jgi:hypothetical protein
LEQLFGVAELRERSIVRGVPDGTVTVVSPPPPVGVPSTVPRTRKSYLHLIVKAAPAACVIVNTDDGTPLAETMIVPLRSAPKFGCAE